MNTISRFVCGETIRRSLEGATVQEILEISEAPEPEPTTSPFAKVLGFHIYAEPTEAGAIKAKRKAGKRKKRG